MAGSRRTMPASPSTAAGSALALVLRPGAPMLSASHALPSRARFLGADIRTLTASAMGRAQDCRQLLSDHVAGNAPLHFGCIWRRSCSQRRDYITKLFLAA